jgi:hypothetical protein
MNAVSKDSSDEMANREKSGAPQVSITRIDQTTGELFDDIRDFLALHPGLATDAILKLTYALIAILFAECADIWPFVSIVAPEAAGSTLLLRMIKAVSVAPLHLGELTLSALLSLPPIPRNTLLLVDQPFPNKELERTLRIMSRTGGSILRNGKFYNICFPAIVCTAEPLRDRWILDQAIQIELKPSLSPTPKFSPESLNESSRKLRGQLTRYRELNLAKVRDSHFDARKFSSPIREIAAMLGNSVPDDPSLQQYLLMLLEPQDQDVRIRRTDSIAAVVTEACLFFSHERGRLQARVGEICDVVNGMSKGRDENVKLDPRAVGNHLRALGLFSERLGRAGRGIRFSKQNRRTIHELAEAYEVRTTRDNSSCEFCGEVKSHNNSRNGEH